MARRKNPYMIVPLKFGDIYDFKDFTKKYMKFRKEDVNRLAVPATLRTLNSSSKLYLNMIQSGFSWVYLIHLICNQFTF
jgi:hypothetical protein